MLAAQRQNAILQELEAMGTVSVSHLCMITGASEATIRRDLNAMAQRGELQKIYGGATLVETDTEAQNHPVDRSQIHMDEKERIAQYAAELINDDDVVFLDSGSTVMYVVEYLEHSKAMFITNSIECACRLMWYRLQTHVIGGILHPGAIDLVGAEALAALGRYNFTKAFLGVDGITIAQGYTVADTEAAAVKSLASSRARDVYVLSDSSKFGKITAATMFPLERAFLITDRLYDPTYAEYTKVIVV